MPGIAGYQTAPPTFLSPITMAMQGMDTSGAGPGMKWNTGTQKWEVPPADWGALGGGRAGPPGYSPSGFTYAPGSGPNGEPNWNVQNSGMGETNVFTGGNIFTPPTGGATGTGNTPIGYGPGTAPTLPPPAPPAGPPAGNGPIGYGPAPGPGTPPPIPGPGTPPPGGPATPNRPRTDVAQGWPFPASGNPADTFGSQSTYQLDPRLQSAYAQLLQHALSRFSDPNGQSYYGGSTVAGLTADGTAAQASLRGAAGAAGGYAGAGGDLYSALLGLGKNPGQDPALDTAIKSMRTNATQSFQDPNGPMAQIRQEAQAGGQYGGTRQGIAEGLASSRLASALSGQEGQMRLDSINSDRTRALDTLKTLPTLLSGTSAPGSMLGAIDSQNRDITQQGYNSDLNAWAYNTVQPDIRLQNLMQMLTGSLPLGGTQYSQTLQPAWYQQLLQNGGPQGGSGSNGLAGVLGLLGLYGALSK